MRDLAIMEYWHLNQKQIIRDVDKAVVEGPHMIESPVLGPISPKELSGGVKTLILIYKDRSHVFNASNCGDNCAKWLLQIAKDEDVTINLRHIMDFGADEFAIEIVNVNKVVYNMKEFVDIAGNFV